MIVKESKWPVGQQADWELRNYRLRLESALATLPVQSADSTVYAGRLAEVVTEQEVRRQRRNSL